MNERQSFLAAIRSMWLNLGRPEACWDAVHDWDLYFRQGARADSAHIAFQDALECE